MYCKNVRIGIRSKWYNNGMAASEYTKPNHIISY